MTSDEKRREVAARLRILASHAPADAEMVLDALDLYQGEYIDGFDPRCVERLADLIEPERTCEIERTEENEFGIYDYLSCGHVAMRQCPKKTQYCPNCGAMVTEKEDCDVREL